MARDCRKKTEYLQNNQTNGWSGTGDKGKGKPGKGKGKNKNKGKDEHHVKQGKGFHEMEEHDDRQVTLTSQDYTDWTDTSWDRADNSNDADWWTEDWSTELWADPAWEQAARQLAPPQPAQEHVRWTVDVTSNNKINKMKGTNFVRQIGTTGTTIGCRTR